MERTERFWIDDRPLKNTFGEDTVGIVDEEAGGIVAYVHHLNAAELVKRWNGYPDLLATCEASLVNIEYCLSNHNLDAEESGEAKVSIRQLEAAIEKARSK